MEQNQLQGRHLNTSEELRHNQYALDKNRITLEISYEEATKQNTCWDWRTEELPKKEKPCFWWETRNYNRKLPQKVHEAFQWDRHRLLAYYIHTMDSWLLLPLFASMSLQHMSSTLSNIMWYLLTYTHRLIFPTAISFLPAEQYGLIMSPGSH